MRAIRIALLCAAGTLAAGATGAPAAEAAGKNPVVVLNTTLGAIHIQLDPAKAPVSTRNFLAYVRAKHYDGTIFHRVIPDFMIQGGGFTRAMVEKPTREPIKNEGRNGLKNRRGTIAMARTSDPESATAQFFINVKHNEALDHPNPDGFGYAVFGKVIKGMAVVDKIKAVPTTSKGGMDDVPRTPVIIRSARAR